jgi:hypothetical protein
MHGCQTGSKHPIFHLKWDQAYPIHLVMMDGTGTVRCQKSDPGPVANRSKKDQEQMN